LVASFLRLFAPIYTATPFFFCHYRGVVADVGRRRTLGDLSLFLPALEDESPRAGAGITDLL
jgi:hypothetical protein